MKKRSNSIPDRDELEKLCQDHTIEQIADKYGKNYKAAAKWLYKYGLKAKRKNPGAEHLDMEKVKELLKGGYTMESVAIMFHVSPQTIRNRLRKEELTYTKLLAKQPKAPGEGVMCEPGAEAMHDCLYWCAHCTCCDYICMTGHKRPCPPWDCTVYQKGKRGRSYG